MKWLLVVAAAAHVSFAGNKFAGPFDVLIKEPFICEEEGTKEVFFNETFIRKKSKLTYEASMRLGLLVPCDDVMQLTVNLAVWGNGGWRPNFLTLDYGGACSAIKMLLPGVFEGFLKQHPEVTACPIPPGDYYVRDVDGSPHVAVDSIPYQKYKVYMKFYKDSDLLGCFGLVVNTIPKEKKKTG